MEKDNEIKKDTQRQKKKKGTLEQKISTKQ